MSREPKDRDPRSTFGMAVLIGLLIAIGLAVLPFVPLLLALTEGALFHTNRVEDFCRQVGIHDELGAIYSTVLPGFN